MKTQKVRIALEINSAGVWQAYGYAVDAADSWEEIMESVEPLEGHHVQRHWIEAEVPVPDAEPAVVAGKAIEVAS